MAVRSLQDGDALGVHYPVSTPSGARMQEISLQAGPEALRAVTFAAGDAACTPLAAVSMDCAATCFLLDVVEDPPAVAREIHRILGDQGVWVNYGPSSGMSALWRFDETELAALLEFTGFSVLETARHRTTHLDLRQIDEWTHYHSHTCYLSVARKRSRGAIPAR